jgi:hypothetical protein
MQRGSTVWTQCRAVTDETTALAVGKYTKICVISIIGGTIAERVK